MTTTRSLRAAAALLASATLAACAHGQKAPAPAQQPPAAEAQAPLDRSKIPEGGPPRTVDLPAIGTFRLANGLQVALIERHELPVVSMRLIVAGAGSAADPKGLPGLASFTANMLDEGAGGRDAQQLALETEKLGAVVGAAAGADASYVFASGLKRVFDPLLGLFADVTLRPNLAPADLTRLQGEVQTQLLRERDHGPTMSRLLMAQLLFDGHPYGSRSQGTQESVGRMNRDLVAGFLKEHYVPAHSTLVVVGDVTRAELEPKLAQAFGGWTAEGSAPLALPQPARHEAPQVALYDRPGAAQSSIVLGLVGLERTSPDYVPTLVMNAVFGGLFNSRLNMNLREDKHWAYGASSAFDARKVPGSFVAAAEVQSDHTAEALQEMLKEMERMRSAPISAEELQAAKNALIHSLPQRFETVNGTASSVSDVLLHGLPLDYWDTFGQKVLAVTPEQVQQMAQKYLHPEQATIVVAGDRAKIAEPIAALKLAPSIEVLDANGKKL